MKCSIVSGPACLPASNRVLVALRADRLKSVPLETRRSLFAKLKRAGPPSAIAPSWLSFMRQAIHQAAAGPGVRFRLRRPLERIRLEGGTSGPDSDELRGAR